jgi:hypothetical protein
MQIEKRPRCKEQNVKWPNGKLARREQQANLLFITVYDEAKNTKILNPSLELKGW